MLTDTQPGRAEDVLPLSNEFFGVHTTYNDDGHPGIIVVRNLRTGEEQEFGTQAAAAKNIEEQTAVLQAQRESQGVVAAASGEALHPWSVPLLLPEMLA